MVFLEYLRDLVDLRRERLRPPLRANMFYIFIEKKINITDTRHITSFRVLHVFSSIEYTVREFQAPNMFSLHI